MGWHIIQIAALVYLSVGVPAPLAEPVSREVCAKELAKRYHAAAEIEVAAGRVAARAAVSLHDLTKPLC